MKPRSNTEFLIGYTVIMWLQFFGVKRLTYGNVIKNLYDNRRIISLNEGRKLP